MESYKTELCKHCGGDLTIRNPKGYCDHLYYPDYCQTCSDMLKAKEPLPIWADKLFAEIDILKAKMKDLEKERNCKC